MSRVPFHRLAALLLAAAALTAVVPDRASAWTLELKRAILKVHLGQASEAERLLVIGSNDVINRMALTGHMPDRVYQSAQKTFADFNRDVAAKAAAENGLDLAQQVAKGPPKPGTDSDYIASSRQGKISVDQVRNTIADYNAKMNEAMGTRDVDYAKKLNTDIMGNHTQMSADDFKAVRKLNNDAYDRIGATEYETKVHADPSKPPPPPPTVDEIADYKRMMRDMIAKKSGEIADLQAKVTDAFKADPQGLKPETRDLEAELQLKRHQQAKYFERYADATNATAKRYGIDLPERTTLSGAASDRSIKPDGRSQSGTAADKAKATQGLSANEAHVGQSIRSEGAIADAGASRTAWGTPDADRLMASAAEQMAGLPPAKQGEILEQVRLRFGNEAARDLADRASRLNSPKTSTPAAETPGVISKAMQVVAIAGMANDLRAILKGEKNNVEIAETAADLVSGGLYSAGASLAEWRKIGQTADKAYQTEKEARVLQIARDLLKRGVDRETVNGVMRDLEAGSEASLDRLTQTLAAKGVVYQRPPPPKPMTFEEFTASGYAKSFAGNLADMAAGMLIAPGKLIYDTGKDIAEVTLMTSDFEKAMGEITDAELYTAEMQSRLGAMAFVKKLVSMGASEAEAQAAVDLWMSGKAEGVTRLRQLRDRLKATGAATTAAKAPEPSPEDLAKRRAHIVERLAQLNHTKLQATLAAVGVVPPDGFYDCLCHDAGYGSSGTRQFYHPGTIGDFNPTYSCSQPGEPCVVSGYGCMRYPLPSSPKVWAGCLAANRVGQTTTADGKVDPNSGETLDAVIERAIRSR
jgi:hypothetical protein